MCYHTFSFQDIKDVIPRVGFNPKTFYVVQCPNCDVQLAHSLNMFSGAPYWREANE